MNLRTLVSKELLERPVAMSTSVLAILLGVAALVAIRHVTVFSEREVGQQLSSLGANILVLPKAASLENYYAADMNGATLPEEHVSLIILASLTGVEKLSPKLSTPIQIGDHSVTLTGILPQSEFQAKAAWQTAMMFQKSHDGCQRASHGPSAESLAPEALATQRYVEDLAPREVLLGAEIAPSLGLTAGKSLVILGDQFTVVAVLPSTGTVDDTRIFAHLHTVQRLTKSGEVVSAIEVFGCCEDAAGDLVPQLQELMPDSRVVTISQVVHTQVGVNRLMARSFGLMLVVLVLVGGASVMSTISSNVRERRREIGTLMALGASPGLIARLFLLKASWLGLGGGIGGTVSGTVLAMWIGSQWAGVRVTPLFGTGLLACGVALGVTLLAAYWPARQAARLDPCNCFREI